MTNKPEKVAKSSNIKTKADKSDFNYPAYMQSISKKPLDIATVFLAKPPENHSIPHAPGQIQLLAEQGMIWFTG